MNELYHHGILGQKWGRRRWQNEDGTYNEAGKKRYFETDVHSARSRLKIAKKAVTSLKSTDSYDKRVRTVNAYRYAKEDLSSEKIKQKLNKETKDKSKHRQKLEQIYVDKGMSQQEAEIAAYKRVRAEKIIAASAALTVAAASAYVAKRHYDATVDKFISKEKTLQNISDTSNVDFDRSVYTAYKDSDKKKYKGLYGYTIKSKDPSKTIFNNTISLDDNIKVASPKTATSFLRDKINSDKQFKNDMSDFLDDYEKRVNIAAMFGNVSPKQERAVEKGMKSFKAGKIDKHVYNMFNLALPESTGGENVKKSFYDELTKHGYNGIMDINDKRMSGYDSKDPIITFNMASKVKDLKSQKISEDELTKSFTKEMLKLSASQFAKRASPYAALGVGGKMFVDKLHKQDDDAFVKKYRRDHPNTKLTYNEILRTYNT